MNYFLPALHGLRIFALGLAMKRYMQRLAIWLFCSYCFCGCAHQAPRPAAYFWEHCESACSKDGATACGYFEDEKYLYCVCARPPHSSIVTARDTAIAKQRSDMDEILRRMHADMEASGQ